MNSNGRLLNNIGETTTKTFNTNNKINSKISNGNQVEKETIQQVGLYGFNIEADRFIRINSTNQGVLEVENSLENKRGFGQVLMTSAGGTAVKADTDLVVQEDPEHREGWNLTNTVGGTKFNLYYFNGTQEVITLGTITSIYARAFINVNSETQSIPFFHIYTKPTGVGDAGPFYHSKIDYIYNSDNTIGIGEECIFYGIDSPITSFSNRHIKFNNKVVTGDGADDEEILYMVFSSDSGATQDAVNITANLLGFDDGTGFLNRNFHLISESSLIGGATEAMQVLQLDQETVIATNSSSIDNKISKGNDLTLTEAQQVLIYGEVTSGPQTGELHPIHITNGGDVEVEIADFKKGQELMADSFPVVIASDQSTLTVYSKINDPVAYTETITVPASGSGNGSPMNTTGYNVIGFSFSSTNTADPVHLQVSRDSLTFHTIQTLTFPIQGEEIQKPAFKYYRLQQTDTTASGHTISVVVSRRVF